jgi:SAM-dependent methyltransferase
VRSLEKTGAGVSRTRYQGVIEIISYNRGLYLLVLIGLLVGLTVSFWLPYPLRTLAFAGTITAALWIFVSLAVSHYVYDLSPLYSLSWLTMHPEHWVNIHSGLDQTTPLLQRKLTGSSFAVFDIFDPEQMTEPSIRRARELSGASDSHRVSWKNLPAKSEEFDAVFLIFAAHELRNTEARHLFFREVTRVLKPGGAALLVEHLRDLPNFLAYGPGCLHFHSRRTWETVFNAAGLRVKRERTITPFVHVFELRRA